MKYRQAEQEAKAENAGVWREALNAALMAFGEPPLSSACTAIDGAASANS